jgi:N-acetylglutamate synthase-like GNAT family acetyltransferase
MSEGELKMLGLRPTTALRGRGQQIVERLLALSRTEGIANTAMARQLQLDARDLEAIIREFVR